MVQACMLDQVHNQTELVPLISCVMMSSDPPPAWLTSTHTTSTTVGRLTQCAQSLGGAQLLRRLGLQTKSLQPPLTSVPWLLFNQQFSAQDMQEGLNNLKALLCNKYLTG